MIKINRKHNNMLIRHQLHNLAAAEREKKLTALRQRNLVALVQDHICINTNQSPHPIADLFPKGVYPIPIDGVSSKAELLDRIFHMREQSWLTPQMLVDFLTVLELEYARCFGHDLRRSPAKWHWPI